MVWAMSLATSLSLAQSVNCPSHGEISPCSCTLKKSGLDIVCEYTDILHISEVMSKLKGRTNAVIFYLRLRHNNLPKLQPYVFLGLDIRHLTIHNSSLSKLEESSLSSIGEYPPLLRSLPIERLDHPFDNVSRLLFFSLFSNRPTEKRFNSIAISTAFSPSSGTVSLLVQTRSRGKFKQRYASSRLCSCLFAFYIETYTCLGP